MSAPVMNLNYFVGKHVAVQLMNSMLMMGPSREDPPKAMPIMVRRGDQAEPLLGVHLEGVLMVDEPRAPTGGMIYDEKAQALVQRIVREGGWPADKAERLADQLHELLVEAYNRGHHAAGSEDTYYIQYAADERYMRTQLHPGAVFAVTTCTGERVVRLHKPETSLITPP